MPADPAATASRLVPELERRGVECAIGGALCLAFWGVPRATKDLDVNVFVSEEGLDPVLEALRATGITVDVQAARTRAAERGDLVAYDEDMRVDIFISFHAFHESARARAVRAALPDGTAASFLSAEDLMVFKTLFYRAKDLVDMDRLLVARPELDIGYVLSWLRRLLGDEDPRLGEVGERHRRAHTSTP